MKAVRTVLVSVVLLAGCRTTEVGVLEPIPIPAGLTEVTGPLLGEDRIGDADFDLTAGRGQGVPRSAAAAKRPPPAP